MRKGVMKIYAAERWLYLHHFRLIPKILKVFIRIVFNATIPYTCEIGGVTLSPRGIRSCFA
jgi:serine acetyltransferase